MPSSWFSHPAALLSLALGNSMPLALYPFVAAPLIQILKLDANLGESALAYFCTYGFAWATLLYPLVLLAGHALAWTRYRRGRPDRAFKAQRFTSVYLLLAILYGIVAFNA